MAALPLNVLYYGQENPLPERHDLQAGPLSATFEQGQLININWRGQEILRRIYVAVRDRDWETVPLELSNLQTHSDLNSFQITFDARHRQEEIDFAWRARIEASDCGRLTFSMEGEALSTFFRSRIGFCLLHSVAECAGKRFSALRQDGSVVEGSFPVAISREWPVPGTQAMTALRYDVSPGLRASMRFEGDLFEMEDQRAWTDASFKTFSTPSDLPCPVEIQRGARVSQAVHVVLTEDHPCALASSSQGAIVITVGTGSAVPLPEIGLGIASHGEALTDGEIERLRALNVSHLRVDLRLWEPGWQASLRRATRETRRLPCSLEAALFVSDSAEDELKRLLKALHEEQPRICRWLIFHRSENAVSAKWILLARNYLEDWNPSTKFGSGTDAYYYDLTGFRPPADGLDFVRFSIQPQVHSCDNASLVETLQMQGVVVNNARHLFDGLPVSVSPVTLKPRFNPDATGALAPPPTGELPRQVDVRQMSLFGAGWTLGSLKYLSESGTSSITYYETTGWRGIMERDTGSPCPNEFRSLPGAVFPLYHVLADAGEFAGGEVVPTRSSDPLKVEAVTFRKHGAQRVLLANLTGRLLRVRVSGLAAPARLTILDEGSVYKAMVSPQEFRDQDSPWQTSDKGNSLIELRPYSVWRIDASGERRS